MLDTTDYQITHEARDSTKWITDMKYSPNGEFLAIGCYDNKIYIYGVNGGYALNGVVGQHQSFISAFDFSEDSVWLRSNCGGFELFYAEADTVTAFVLPRPRPSSPLISLTPFAGSLHSRGGATARHRVGHAVLQHDVVRTALLSLSLSPSHCSSSASTSASTGTAKGCGLRSGTEQR